MSTYTKLTQEERYQIYALMKVGHTPSEIAEVLGRHKSTISRELNRNRGLRGYRPKQAIIGALQPHTAHVHTITYYNGKEFALHSEIADTLDARGFFANSCHSWERGLNQNMNCLIRQYLPKGKTFGSLTQ